MSVEALNWALNLAPVPMDTGGKKPKPNPACAAVLQGMANHAGPDGRNAFPSVRRLMRYTRLSERTVRTCIDRLAADKIILPGDPAIVAAYIKRGDKRPEIWNLDMTLIRNDLTEEDIAELEQQFPGLGQRIRNGVQPLHLAQDGVQPLHPEAPERGATTPSGVQPTQERGAAVAPEPYVQPYKETSHPPSEGESRARDAHPRANTPPGRDVSTGSPERHAVNSTSGVPGEPVPVRLPADWRPSPELLAWAAEKVPGLDVEWETVEFVHYWSVEAPAQSPKSPRAKKPARWEKVDWGQAWQNRMKDRWEHKGLSRRPASVAAPEPDLFAAVDAAESAAIVDPWLAYWDQRGTVVTPVLRSKLTALVGAALSAGRDPELIKSALKACKEPYPAQWKWDKAMAGIDPDVSAGTMSRQEREQQYADEQSAASWQRIMEREAAGQTSPNDSVREIIEASLRKSGVMPEQDSTPGAAVSRPVLRGEIAQ